MRQAAVVINKVMRRGAIKGPGKEAVGITSKVVNPKNQMEPPCRSAEYDFKPAFGHGVGVDQAKDVFTIGLTLDVIKQNGASYCFRGERIDVGKEKAMATIAADPALMNEIRREVMASKKELPVQVEIDVDREALVEEYAE